jgi:hypothetical protein
MTHIIHIKEQIVEILYFNLMFPQRQPLGNSQPGFKDIGVTQSRSLPICGWDPVHIHRIPPMVAPESAKYFNLRSIK